MDNPAAQRAVHWTAPAIVARKTGANDSERQLPARYGQNECVMAEGRKQLAACGQPSGRSKSRGEPLRRGIVPQAGHTCEGLSRRHTTRDEPADAFGSRHPHPSPLVRFTALTWVGLTLTFKVPVHHTPGMSRMGRRFSLPEQEDMDRCLTTTGANYSFVFQTSGGRDASGDGLLCGHREEFVLDRYAEETQG